MIKRFNPPTHLDPMPYLSEWHHEMEDGSVQIWVQTNEVVDENSKPHWRRLGDLYEQACLLDIKDSDELCCWLYPEDLLRWIKSNKDLI